MLKILAAKESTVQLGPRILLRIGERFKVAGGPTYNGARIGLRGTFELRRIKRFRRRLYLDAVQVECNCYGGWFTLFVAGKLFRSRQFQGIVMRPYRVRKVRVA